MFDDGPVMSVVDGMLLVSGALAVVFLVLYGSLMPWWRSRMGWLIVGNALAWLLVCVGGILYRVNLPDAAAWTFLPLALGVPTVLAWWIDSLLRTRRCRSGHHVALIEQWQADGWLIAGERGREREAAQLFRCAEELAAHVGRLP